MCGGGHIQKIYLIGTKYSLLEVVYYKVVHYITNTE